MRSAAAKSQPITADLRDMVPPNQSTSLVFLAFYLLWKLIGKSWSCRLRKLRMLLSCMRKQRSLFAKFYLFQTKSPVVVNLRGNNAREFDRFFVLELKLTYFKFLCLHPLRLRIISLKKNKRTNGVIRHFLRVTRRFCNAKNNKTPVIFELAKDWLTEQILDRAQTKTYLFHTL